MIEASRISEVLKDCLFKNEEIVDGVPIFEPLITEGITTTFGFNPKRVLDNEKEINTMLDEMDTIFVEGWSFLNLCYDKDDNQWTGSHKTMEELMCLGMAIGRVSYCTPDKDIWALMPGGMPYIVIENTRGARANKCTNII